MSEWLHCNVCSLRYTPSKKIFLTECGHLTCETCVEKIKETGKCVVCDKSTTPMQLSKDMDPSIYDYFLPFDAHIKKLMEIYNFQKQHKDKLQQILMQKYNYAKKECINCHAVSKQLVKENKMLRSMLKQSNNGSKSQFSTSTPLDNIPLGLNNSVDNLSLVASSVTPGYARRLSNIGLGNSAQKGHVLPSMYQNPYSGSSFSSGPSPAQMVPGGVKAPLPGLHRPLGPRAPFGAHPGPQSRKGPLSFPSRK